MANEFINDVPSDVGMKRVINGKAYNTATSTEICGADLPSGACWSLYQTRNSEFFKVVVDHGGEDILHFGPVTEDEARKLVAEYAKHLLPRYFGDAHDAGERRLTIRLPHVLADRVDAAAKAQGVSINNFAMRAFEREVRSMGLGNNDQPEDISRLKASHEIWAMGERAEGIDEGRCWATRVASWIEVLEVTDLSPLSTVHDLRRVLNKHAGDDPYVDECIREDNFSAPKTRGFIEGVRLVKNEVEAAVLADYRKAAAAKMKELYPESPPFFEA